MDKTIKKKPKTINIAQKTDSGISHHHETFNLKVCGSNIFETCFPNHLININPTKPKNNSTVTLLNKDENRRNMLLMAEIAIGKVP